jgi:HEAT repeat protein
MTAAGMSGVYICRNMFDLDADVAARIQGARAWLNDANAEVRLVAADLLAKNGDVSNAPVLIAALSDPEYAVVEAAHEALKRISHGAKSTRLPVPDAGNCAAQLETVRKTWREWYHGIDPTYQAK